MKQYSNGEWIWELSGNSIESPINILYHDSCAAISIGNEVQFTDANCDTTSRFFCEFEYHSETTIAQQPSSGITELLYKR